MERVIGIGTTPKFVETDNWPGVPQPGFIASFQDLEQCSCYDFFMNYLDNEFEGYETKPDAYYTLKT